MLSEAEEDGWINTKAKFQSTLTILFIVRCQKIAIWSGPLKFLPILADSNQTV